MGIRPTLRSRVVLCLLSFLTSCAPQNRPEAQAPKPPAIAAACELRTGIARNGSATFHNFNGRFIRMDGDMDLRLLPGGEAEMIVNSISIYECRGTYEIDPCGTLFIGFEEAGHWGWPTAYVIDRDAKSLTLRPRGPMIYQDSSHPGIGDLYHFRLVTSKGQSNFKD